MLAVIAGLGTRLAGWFRLVPSSPRGLLTVSVKTVCFMLTEEVSCSGKEALFSTPLSTVAGQVSCLLSTLHADLHEGHVISQISHVTSITIHITPVEPELSAGWSHSATNS